MLDSRLLAHISTNLGQDGLDAQGFEAVNLSTALQVGYWDRYKALDGDLAYIEDGKHPNRADYEKLGLDLANKIRFGG